MAWNLFLMLLAILLIEASAKPLLIDADYTDDDLVAEESNSFAVASGFASASGSSFIGFNGGFNRGFHGGFEDYGPPYGPPFHHHYRKRCHGGNPHQSSFGAVPPFHDHPGNNGCQGHKGNNGHHGNNGHRGNHGHHGYPLPPLQDPPIDIKDPTVPEESAEQTPKPTLVIVEKPPNTESPNVVASSSPSIDQSTTTVEPIYDIDIRFNNS